jgi:hypothetical protein
MQPAFILLLVVAGSFLAFALVPNNHPPAKKTSEEYPSRAIPKETIRAVDNPASSGTANVSKTSGEQLAASGNHSI